MGKWIISMTRSKLIIIFKTIIQGKTVPDGLSHIRYKNNDIEKHLLTFLSRITINNVLPMKRLQAQPKEENHLW